MVPRKFLLTGKGYVYATGSSGGRLQAMYSTCDGITNLV
jgi:hypothetical protein